MPNRKDITLQDQLAQRANWSDPLVDAVVATFCFREVDGALSSGVLDAYEWLVSKRQRGNEKGQLQAHHGGFMKVTDHDIWGAALRELREEVGYTDVSLQYLTSIGPAIFRSTARVAGDVFTLDISKEETEPNVGFALPLFIADVTGLQPVSDTDGEVSDLQWLTAREIVARYGQPIDRPYSSFNYFQMLSVALLHQVGRWNPASRSISHPGTYSFEF